MSRARLAAPVAIALGAFLALAAAAPASAHSQVVASDPSDGSTIATLPAELSITANEDLLDLTGTGQGFALYLVGADGMQYGGSPLALDGPTVSTPTPASLPAGDYTMRYQIVSADTHPVSGSIAFRYAPTGAGSPTPSAGSTLLPCGDGSGGSYDPNAVTPGDCLPTGPLTTPSSVAASPPVPTTGPGDASPDTESTTSPAATALNWAVPVGVVVLVAIIVFVVLLRRGRRR